MVREELLVKDAEAWGIDAGLSAEIAAARRTLSDIVASKVVVHVQATTRGMQCRTRMRAVFRRRAMLRIAYRKRDRADLGVFVAEQRDHM